MHIGIDLRPFQINYKGRGIGTYTSNIIKALSKVDNKNDYTIFYKDGEDIIELSNPKFILKKLNLPNKPTSQIYNGLFNQTIFPYQIKKNKIDIFYFCDLNIPLIKPCKTIATICDLIPLKFKEFSERTLPNKIGYKLKLASVKKADKIISISENTKKDIVELLHIPESKIKVIYLGIDESFKIFCNDDTEKIKNTYNNFILCVSGFSNKSKNVKGLVEAYLKLPNELRKNYNLVLTGEYQNSEIANEIISSIKHQAPNIKYLITNDLMTNDLMTNKTGEIIFVGQVPSKYLPALYNASSLFVFPSFYEGFGLPPLEAMACGVPVIASNTSSIPEVVGDAGILVNPYNIDELSNAIQKVLINKELQEEMKEKGLKRANKFSWEKCAEEIIELYC